jgi:hypothetical protein
MESGQEGGCLVRSMRLTVAFASEMVVDRERNGLRVHLTVDEVLEPFDEDQRNEEEENVGMVEQHCWR